jgi:hypothetical protein
MEFDGTEYNKKHFEDEKPCNHPGCLSHVSHQCEGCDRIASKYPTMTPERLAEILKETLYWVSWPDSAYKLLADELLKRVRVEEKRKCL